MLIYFIRHASALEKEEWQGDDIKRPLSKEGKREFKKFFKKIYRKLESPDIILSSDATRARETTRIVSKYFKKDYKIDKRLNPSATVSDYKSVIDYFKEKNIEKLCIIGHEPGLTSFISYYLTEGKLLLKMKKGSLCIVRDNILYALYQLE